MPCLHRSFSAKEPYREWLFGEIMGGSVAKNDVQLKPSYMSSPPSLDSLMTVGSIKLWVFFAEYSLFVGALSQKRPVILSLLADQTAAHHSGSPWKVTTR